MEYGISLSIPPDAVPPGIVQRISVRPCVSGPFKFPDEYEPLSAVYLITHNAEKLELKPEQKVELTLEHYARLETDQQANQMTFLSASPPERDSGQQVIEFRPVRGGTFPVHERNGVLPVNHFCYNAIGGTRNSHESKQYIVVDVYTINCYFCTVTVLQPIISYRVLWCALQLFKQGRRM